MACVLVCALCVGAFAQVSVSEDTVGLYSYGVAGSDQAITSSTQPGYYSLMKNGYYVNTNLTAKINVASFYDIFVKLNMRSRTGSPYLELQQTNASNQASVISLDSAYGRLNLTTGLKLGLPVDFYVQMGKFSVAAANYQKSSLYGTEAALSMLKLNSGLYAGIETTKIFSTIEQMLDTSYSSLSFQAYTNAGFDEAVERLYDSDGSIGSHGESVLGEYATQAFATLKLNGYSLPFGVVSAEGVYMLNGAGIYSGNSFGLSGNLTLSLIPENENLETLSLPIGLGVAYYDKNIDVLAAATGNDASIVAGADSTDFRGTIKAGLGAGLKYAVQYEKSAELYLAGSYTRVEHIYRDTIDIFGLSVDGKVSILDRYFMGAGCILGTLNDVTWKTSSGVSASNDNYSHTFKLAQNMGWEAYLGANLGTKCSIVLGVNNNKGLSMNYGLESVKDGETKQRQSGTQLSEGLYQTFGIYLKTTVKM
jgi:hypothetical protein